MPRGLRNNNPGNIERAADRWLGMSEQQPDPRFVHFKTMAYGYRALFKVLHTYITKYRLNTVPAIFHRYAPNNENNTNAYIRSVLNEIGGTEETVIVATDEKQMKALAKAITRVENGRSWFETDIDEGWRLYLRSINR